MTAALDWISNFLYAAILAGVPLLFGTLGEISYGRKPVTSTWAWKA